MLCPQAKHVILYLVYTGSTQEDRKMSRHDWKIVDWDVKHQFKQTIYGNIHNLYLIETPLKVFANRADSDLAALERAA